MALSLIKYTIKGRFIIGWWKLLGQKMPGEKCT